MIIKILKTIVVTAKAIMIITTIIKIMNKMPFIC